MSNETDTLKTANAKKDLDIGKDAITIENRTYPKNRVDHVCEVKSKTYDNTFPAWSLLLAFLTLLIVLMVYAAGFLNAEGDRLMAFTLAFALCLNAFVQYITWKTRSKDSYNMELKLNSGETYNFESDNEQLIKEKQRAAKKLVGY